LVAAVAGNLDFFPSRIFAILTAEFIAFRDRAAAGWMRALFNAFHITYPPGIFTDLLAVERKCLSFANYL